MTGEKKNGSPHLEEYKPPCQEVNAKSLSAIFVRQIGHSEQASEQDLHTANETLNNSYGHIR